MGKVSVQITASVNKADNNEQVKMLAYGKKRTVPAFEVVPFKDFDKTLEKELKQGVIDQATIDFLKKAYSKGLKGDDLVLGTESLSIPGKSLKDVSIRKVFNIVDGRVYGETLPVYSYNNKLWITGDSLDILQ